MVLIFARLILGRQSFFNRPQRLDRGQVAVLEVGIKRRCDELVSLGEQMKGVRQDTREAVSGGELRYMERRRRKKHETAEFNQFKQARTGRDGGGDEGSVGQNIVHFVASSFFVGGDCLSRLQIMFEVESSNISCFPLHHVSTSDLH